MNLKKELKPVYVLLCRLISKNGKRWRQGTFYPDFGFDYLIENR